MFCPNCGKKLNDYDNFCKFCGHSMRETSYIETPNAETKDYEKTPLNASATKSYTVEIPSIMERTPPSEVQQSIDLNIKVESEDEEIVVYEIKKHSMSLFWPAILSPLCIAYFWKVYVIIQSFAGFLVGLLFLLPIVYPILRYYVDKAVITTSNLHIQQGVYDYAETSVPLNKINLINMRRSFLGKLANYGHLIIESETSDTRTVYKYIENPDDVLFILRNPSSYIQEYLK